MEVDCYSILEEESYAGMAVGRIEQVMLGNEGKGSGDNRK